MEQKNRNLKDTAILIGLVILLLLGCLAFFSARWYIREFGDTGFDSILYTLFSEMSGTDSTVILDFMTTAILPGLVAFVVLTLFLWAKRGNGEKWYPFTNTNVCDTRTIDGRNRRKRKWQECIIFLQDLRCFRRAF